MSDKPMAVGIFPSLSTTAIDARVIEHLADALGGRATPTKAEQAANHIGRHHKFVLSQLTATYGGSRTVTGSRSWADSIGDALTVGWNTGWNADRSGGILTGITSHGSSRGNSGGRSRSASRSWTDDLSWAEVITKPCEPLPSGHPPNRTWLVSRSRRG